MSISNALTEIAAIHGMSGYGRYWRLIELLCEKFDGVNDDLFVFSARELRECLGYHHTKSLRKYLQCMANVGLMSFECTDNVIKIKTDILLRLQGRDYKKARAKRDVTPPKKESKNKKESKEREKEKKKELPRSSNSFIKHPVIDKKHQHTFDDVQELFIKICVNDKIKPPPFFSKETLDNYLILEGFMGNIKKWSEFFGVVSASGFLNGCNDRNFIASFNWLMKPENAEKVLTGTYANKKIETSNLDDMELE